MDPDAAPPPAQEPSDAAARPPRPGEPSDPAPPRLVPLTATLLAAAVRVPLLLALPVLYGGDPILRLMHLDRLVIAHHLPGWQAVLVALDRAGGGPDAARWLTAAVAVAGVPVWTAVVARLAGPWPALVFAAAFATAPPLVAYSLCPFNEPLLLLSLGLALLGFVHRERRWGWPLCGLAMAVACLTRYEAALVGAALALAHAAGVRTWRARLARAATAGLVLGAAPLAWILAWRGLAPPGAYSGGVTWTPALLVRIPYLAAKIALDVPLAVVPAAWGAWLCARGEARDVTPAAGRFVVGIGVAFVVFWVLCGPEAPMGTPRMTERSEILPLVAVLVLAGIGTADLARRLARPHLPRAAALIGAALGAVLAVPRTANLARDPKVVTAYAVAATLRQRLRPGEQAAVCGPGAPEDEKRLYLERMAARGPAAVAAARRLHEELALPEDYVRIALALGRERTLLWPPERAVRLVAVYPGCPRPPAWPVVADLGRERQALVLERP